LHTRFPPRNEPGTASVAEALRSRLPVETALAETALAETALAETARRTLPRRIRNMSVSARPAEPKANPELLLRILDGLQRL
jgi:hypothetical protein